MKKRFICRPSKCHHNNENLCNCFWLFKCFIYILIYNIYNIIIYIIIYTINGKWECQRALVREFQYYVITISIEELVLEILTTEGNSSSLSDRTMLAPAITKLLLIGVTITYIYNGRGLPLLLYDLSIKNQLILVTRCGGVMAFPAKFVMRLCLVFVKMKYDKDVLKI